MQSFGEMSDYTEGYGEEPDSQWEEHGDREREVWGEEEREDLEAQYEAQEAEVAKAKQDKELKKYQKQSI